MKTAGITLVVLSLVFGGWLIGASIMADYEFSNSMQSYWELSVKSSNLEVKADYLNKFVDAVEANHLTGNNAIWLKTPDNSIEQNMIALRSLQSRMNEIKGMDVQSFAYQQAIQQITAQEQGEAEKLLGTIKGVWFLRHHFLLWDWVSSLIFVSLIGGLGLGVLLIVAAD